MIGRITAMIRFARCRKFLFQCISIGVILAMVASACLFKLASIQLIDGQMAAQAATQARTKKVIVHSMRGKITDTNGTVLAQSVERYTIIADPWAASQFEPIDCDTQKAKQAGFCHKVNGKPVGVKGSAGVARLLAPVLKMDAKTLGAKLTGTSRYMILKKDVTPTVKRAIDDLNLGGVVYGELSSQRIYANGTQLGALLGGVDDSGKGVAGVESMENSALTGTDGYVIYQQGNGGEEIPGTLTGSQEAVNGSDVALTLDHDVDWYVKQALLEGQKKTKATWAMAVVQDIQTGEILALEDTDEYQAGSDQAKLNASRAVSESFEPGSVGKVITMSGLLQTGLHKATSSLCPIRTPRTGRNTMTRPRTATSTGLWPASSRTPRTWAWSWLRRSTRRSSGTSTSRSSASASPVACPSLASRAGSSARRNRGTGEPATRSCSVRDTP